MRSRQGAADHEMYHRNYRTQLLFSYAIKHIAER